MPGDRILQGESQPVVHQAVAGAQSPQRRSADLSGGPRIAWIRKYRYAITGADVMQQEVAVRVDQLVAERYRHGVGATIDDGAGARGPDARYVAARTADGAEQLLAGQHVAGNRAARRRLGGAHEVG